MASRQIMDHGDPRRRSAAGNDAGEFSVAGVALLPRPLGLHGVLSPMGISRQWRLVARPACVVGVCLCLFFVFWFFVLVSPAADYSKSRLPGAASIGLNAATANFQPEIAVSRARYFGYLKTACGNLPKAAELTLPWR